MNIIKNFKTQLNQTYLNIQELNQGKNQNQSCSQLEQEAPKDPEFEDREQDQFHYFSSLNKKCKQASSKCVVCSKVNAKYTCPSCQVPYCSAAHYKSHNLFCSQRFYRNQVQNQLKSTKSSKQQKLKTIELLKKNKQELGKDESEFMKEVSLCEIDESRLLNLLQKIENGQDVVLEENQQKIFERYVQIVQNGEFNAGEIVENKKVSENTAEDEQRPEFALNTPFWEIEDGLSCYFLKSNLQIQEYSSSIHQQLINYRIDAGNILREKLEKLSHLKKILPNLSKEINFELIQISFLSVLLYRVTNGGENHNIFAEMFENLYQDNFGKKIKELSQLSSSHVQLQVDVIELIKTKILNDQLLSPWSIIVIEDLQTIFTKKYFVLELIFRLIEIFEPKKNLKLIKKLELLLVYSNESLFGAIKSQNLQIILNKLNIHKQKHFSSQNDRKTMRDNLQSQKQLRLNGIILPK